MIYIILVHSAFILCFAGLILAAILTPNHADQLRYVAGALLFGSLASGMAVLGMVLHHRRRNAHPSRH